MTIRHGMQLFLLAIAVAIVPSKIHAQDNITCNTDDFEANNCGGCDYGYNFDGSCQDGGAGGAGGACPSENPSTYLTTYDDLETNEDGRKDKWATTSNSDETMLKGHCLRW